jgi:hypothetical protein
MGNPWFILRKDPIQYSFVITCTKQYVQQLRSLSLEMWFYSPRAVPVLTSLKILRNVVKGFENG